MSFDLGPSPSTRPPTQAEKQQIKSVLALSASDITDASATGRAILMSSSEAIVNILKTDINNLPLSGTLNIIQNNAIDDDTSLDEYIIVNYNGRMRTIPLADNLSAVYKLTAY